MPEVFGSKYSDSYDLLYRDKDYSRECDLVEQCIKNYGAQSSSHILDLGCGTGTHAIELARRGHHVHGVDLSAAMLAIAREKGQQARKEQPSLALEFSSGNVTEIRLPGEFDVVLMMFAVLGYQVEAQGVQLALANVRRHLKAGGLFVADFWYGPAVLQTQPSDRIRTIKNGEVTTLRAAHGQLDSFEQIATVDYDVWVLDSTKLISSFKERHEMRFFFPQEIKNLLASAGFELLKIAEFPTLDVPVTDQSWNALLVARAT
ncbi:MAG: class I SAM-dependent methyltransferase [Gammaproteobacteria bacterium]